MSDHHRDAPRTLVTVATYTQALEARVALTRLEESGIEAFLADENLVTMNWMWSNAVGGVKLQVHGSDAERAGDLLALDVSADTPSPAPEDSDPDEACPVCGSERVGRERYRRRLVYVSWLLLSVPLPFLRRSHRCQECGLRWKPQPVR